MSADAAPILLWFRRDFRLTDHPALDAAARSGRPVIPVFLNDEVVRTYGAAPTWRLGLAAEAFAERLKGIGSRLTFREGRAAEALARLADETGARTVWWTRAYDPASLARDEAVKEALVARGVDCADHPGHLLFEPESVRTGQDGYYKVYTPYWRKVKDRDPGPALTAPTALQAPDGWPETDDPAIWGLGTAMNRGAAIVAPHCHVGEAAAQTRLAVFLRDRVEGYATARDIPAMHGTSGLSENLTYGEISIRSCWHSAQRAIAEGKRGAPTFLKELVWREFAYHLLYHTPRLITGNWRPEWDAFPWNEDAAGDDATAWKRGRTGMPFVDAAMREMFVTGTMHNRARMIVASYLTKHLMCHWKIGMHWFEECLIDWDPANNAMGWQWSAGSGPDATPFFRVFNPETQLDRFDADRTYIRRWIAEGRDDPDPCALAYFDAIPRRWGMAADDAYPDPIVTAAEGRARALDAYRGRDL
ncbi:deoxyribodipyrimidine photolyase, putative [Oceaniovalibus guishaninsula JLT2003]|uniref:Deoxyribodipyrimidine photolyase, putative n=1 Tax=Oceaniovalibus guishaninsula JLT2003 TaxID=1231392 RepID=K2HBS2_9RHOB|nr:deoxyribodipyrimidine photo-lyase [Oceaniovalibus guishaninsula]EKE44057.1 deoxyribodipyrimidine photolyase, putative [Oceaniovalibus guishaninsula JLT2003]